MSERTDLDYLREAYEFARDNSPDISTKNAALLVDKRGIVVARAANTFPRGIEITSERLHARPDKYDYTGHAEENVILAYTRYCEEKGTPTNFRDLKMYCPWAACGPCGRHIMGVGISKVISHKSPLSWDFEDEARNGRKDFSRSIALALEMFREAGVEFVLVDGVIGGGLESLHSGRIRFP